MGQSNIELFAICTATIMDTLYKAFPMSTSLDGSAVTNELEPTCDDTAPRIVEPNEHDYEDIYASAHGRELTEEEIANNDPSAGFINKSVGKPVYYYTMEQRNVVKEKRTRVHWAASIFDSTIIFLQREGYISLEGKLETNKIKYVLTSKGFSHLNKKFENGTIVDEFQICTAKRLLTAVKEGGAVATAGKALVGVVSAYLGG